MLTLCLRGYFLISKSPYIRSPSRVCDRRFRFSTHDDWNNFIFWIPAFAGTIIYFLRIVIPECCYRESIIKVSYFLSKKESNKEIFSKSKRTESIADAHPLAETSLRPLAGKPKFLCDKH